MADDRKPEPPPPDAGEWDVQGEPPRALVDLINRVLDRGVVVGGDVTISVAGVDLVYLGLNALLTSVATARETIGRRPATGGMALPPPPAPRRRPPADAGGETPGGESLAGTVPSPTVPVAGSAGSDVSAGGGDALAAELSEVARALPDRIDVDPEGVQRDLARLVMVIVELLRRVVEHQAVRRMDDDDLSREQVERMGLALAALDEKMKELQQVFGLADADLNIDLGPLGKIL